MPFVDVDVEVWVDPEPCDGTCARSHDAKRLQEVADEARHWLILGDPASALSVLTDGLDPCAKTPEVMAQEYALWISGKLPGFIGWKTSAVHQLT